MAGDVHVLLFTRLGRISNVGARLALPPMVSSSVAC